ncbi:MAG: prolyl-tRNA editing enzyme YbaK/EbsC (Cys-tRNA(Pro) deacylase) [Paracoccaceae bacterium]
MGKSLKRVKAHIAALGLDLTILEVTVPTNTAQQAADALGCGVDQIVKSVIFCGAHTGKAILFLTSGSNRVDVEAASALAGQPLGKADAALIRAQTGFAIGGVSPFGHLNQIQTFMDRHLLDHGILWAAAGTPHHMFDISPNVLADKTNAQVANFTET